MGIKKALKEVKKAQKDLVKKTCIMCGKEAVFCMRGLPDHTYCRDCAQEYFKLLSYLDKL